MARGVRIQCAEAYYHVRARANRREVIFLDNDDDRRFFLATHGEACTMAGWRVHAWVLMNNHYHLFLETPEPNLVARMQWLQNTFTRRFNVRHRAWSRVFGDRYMAVMVQSEGGNYHKSRGRVTRRQRKYDLTSRFSARFSRHGTSSSHDHFRAHGLSCDHSHEPRGVFVWGSGDSQIDRQFPLEAENGGLSCRIVGSTFGMQPKDRENIDPLSHSDSDPCRCGATLE